MQIFKQVLDNVIEGVFVINTDLQITFVNKQFEKVFQVTRDDILYQHADDFFCNPPNHTRLIQRTVEEKKEFSYDCLQFYCYDRNYFLRVQTKLIEENGEITGAVCYFEDITEQIERNVQLMYENQTMNRKFYEIFNNANDAMLLYKLDGTEYEVFFVNQAAIDLLQYTEEEFLNLGPFSLSDESYRSKADELRDVFLKENKFDVEWLYRSKSGKKIPVDLSISKFRIHAQEYMLVIAKDITERKKAEAELIEVNAFHTALINSLENGIAVNENGQLRMTNDKWYEILGLDPKKDHFLDKTAEERYALIQPFIKNFSKLRELAASVAQERKIVQNQEFELADGRTIEFDFIPLIISDKYHGHLWVTRDVSYRKRTEKSLLDAREEAIRANKAKNIFLSQMSHDLRTPLNSIIGFSQILLNNEDLSYLVGHKSTIKRILNAGGHLSSLIKDMLDFSLIEAGDIQLDIKPAQLKPMLIECVRTIQGDAEKRGINLNLLSISSALYLEIDEVRFKQIIFNLLSNAIKYNQINGSVTIGTEEENSSIKVFVKDTGQGISQEDQENIFSPMFRSSAHKDIEGTGLGLAIVAELSEKMNGTHGVKSNGDTGSEFWVSFPKCDKPSQDEKEGTDKIYKEAEADSFQILYIEDNLDNLLLVREILKITDENIELLHAEDGKSGLQAIRNNRIDLILLDMNLPDISGEEVLKQIKDDTAFSDVPIIVLSANALVEQRERAYFLGCSDYLTKPLDIKRFQAMLHSYSSINA